jgi:anti-sigma factor RsiW
LSHRLETSVTCRDFVDLVIGYLEGELDANTRARFDQHRATCWDCPHYLTHYRETIQASAAAWAGDVRSAMPEDLVRAILAARNSSQTT